MIAPRRSPCLPRSSPFPNRSSAWTEPAPTDLSDLVLLTMISGVGPHTCAALLERFQTPGCVLDASLADLRDVAGVVRSSPRRSRRPGRDLDAEAEIELCRRAGVD